MEVKVGQQRNAPVHLKSLQEIPSLLISAEEFITQQAGGYKKPDVCDANSIE